MQNYNVVFMGTSKFAVPILEGLLESSVTIQAVFSAPPKLANRGMKQTLSPVAKCAEEYQLPVEYPATLRDPEIVNKLRALNADLFVVVAFRMLPEQVWMLPRLGTFNLHGSLLPKYRGAAPLHWAVINGERQTGLTTFLLDKMIDTGGILLQQTIDIAEEHTKMENKYALPIGIYLHRILN